MQGHDTPTDDTARKQHHPTHGHTYVYNSAIVSLQNLIHEIIERIIAWQVSWLVPVSRRLLDSG